MSPSELEKKNLEMHVALQEMKEHAITEKLENIESCMEDISLRIKEFKEYVYEKSDKVDEEMQEKFNKIELSINDLWDEIQSVKDGRSTQLTNWGFTLIILLLGAIGTLLYKVVIPLMLGQK
jgi:t-SNARE complex subunit (syntaxin)